MESRHDTLSMNKILILGGTGAMGEHLVRLFCHTDCEVHVTTRRYMTSSGNILYIKGDAHNSAFLMNLLRNNYDIIVDFMAYGTEEFQSKCFPLLDNCRQYVFLSSSRAYSDSDGLITEETPLLANVCLDGEYLATDEYALAKGREENILRTSGKKNWTIIRPYITYGEKRLQLGVFEKEDWLYRAMQGRTIVFSKDIATKYTTLTYGQDVAKGIFQLLGNSEALGQAFHITVSKTLKWQDILQIYLDELQPLLGYRPKVLMQDKAYNLRLPWKKWQVLYDRYFDRCFNNEKIGKFVDVELFMQPDEGLRKCIRSFVHDPNFSNLDWRTQAKFDRLVGECAKWHEFQTMKERIKYYIRRFVL